MPFLPPSWVPPLNLQEEIPDSISIPEFFLSDKYGRLPCEHARAPFVDALSGNAPSIQTVKSEVDYLARGLAKELGWQVSAGTQSDRVVGIFSVNTVCDTNALPEISQL